MNYRSSLVYFVELGHAAKYSASILILLFSQEIKRNFGMENSFNIQLLVTIGIFKKINQYENVLFDEQNHGNMKLPFHSILVPRNQFNSLK